MRACLLGLAVVLLLTGCRDERCVNPGHICRVAGTGNSGFNGDGRPAKETELYQPTNVRTAPDGRVFVMDFNNHRLRFLDREGRLRTFAGSGEHSLAEPGPATGSGLENPVDFAMGAAGETWMVSIHDPRVLKVTAEGELSVVAGNGVFADSGDHGPAFAASFLSLWAVAYGADGSVYVADAEAHRVRVIRPNGVIEPFAGTGSAGQSGDGALATAATLSRPVALALGTDGAVYIASAGAHVIRRVGVDGVIATVAGTGVAGFSGDGGAASAATLSSPEGIALSPDGRLFIADSGNHRIREVAVDGTVRTIAGTGRRALSGDGGPALEAALARPVGLSWSPEGDLLIADLFNSCVRKVRAPAP